MDAVRVPPSAWITSQSIKDGCVPQLGQVDHRPHGAPYQALDLVGAPANVSFRGFRAPCVSASRRGSWRNSAGDPTLAGVSAENAARSLRSTLCRSRACLPTSIRQEPSAVWMEVRDECSPDASGQERGYRSDRFTQTLYHSEGKSGFDVNVLHVLDAMAHEAFAHLAEFFLRSQVAKNESFGSRDSGFALPIFLRPPQP